MKKNAMKAIAASLAMVGMLSSAIPANACTSLILPTTDGSYVYGRTMEFGIPLKSEMMVSPRNLTRVAVWVALS